MKIRSAFVSNSSSSSYIIALKEDAANPACPTCGRKDPSLIEHIAANTNCYSGDSTEIINEGRTATRAHYQREYDETAKELEIFDKHAPDEVDPVTLSWSEKGTTFGTKAEWARSDMEYFGEILKSIDQVEGEIYEIQISYGDHVTQDIFETLQRKGLLTVVKGD